MQALWFDQYFQNPLQTQDGEEIEIIQPGIWNHSAGPDFLNAAIRFQDGRIEKGAVEIHLCAEDWHRHHHNEDPNYEETILHVVWKKPSKAYFPSTKNFHYVPQVVLENQLFTDFPTLKKVIDIPQIKQRPSSHAGICQSEFEKMPVEKVIEILEAAGIYRIKIKSERLFWRGRIAGAEQTLWEALSESMGYGRNQLPFRLAAQRLPLKPMRRFTPLEREACLFGIVNLLPKIEMQTLDPRAQKRISSLWDAWWRLSPKFPSEPMPRYLWNFSGVRPWNRPERRLAALSSLLSSVRALQRTLESGDVKKFKEVLSGVSHEFWKNRTSLAGKELCTNSSSPPLIGKQRIADIVINIFSPYLWRHDEEAAYHLLNKTPMANNRKIEIARQRVLGNITLRRPSTLLKQGLLQIYQDYCMEDISACQDCLFPKFIKTWKK